LKDYKKHLMSPQWSTKTVNYNQAIMSSRQEPLDSLDFFPTPPWGTRAFMEFVFPQVCSTPAREQSVWEPAAGEGHMAEPLKEYFGTVSISDVHDYGRGYGIGSFVGQGPDVLPPQHVDWIITNPPFTLAEDFVRRALIEARVGVAILARSVFIESDGRFPLFGGAFRAFCPFASRLPMVKGRWDPKASSATSYAWFVWCRELTGPLPRAEVIMIPPGAKARCTRPDDVARFAQPLG
jgi:hypothetical protein